VLVLQFPNDLPKPKRLVYFKYVGLGAGLRGYLRETVALIVNVEIAVPELQIKLPVRPSDLPQEKPHVFQGHVEGSFTKVMS
jgi:hypothetical protein